MATKKSLSLNKNKKLQKEVSDLEEKSVRNEQEIAALLAEGYEASELEKHIDALHKYNDMKDIGQMLIGKIATEKGVTTASLYDEFDLSLED